MRINIYYISHIQWYSINIQRSAILSRTLFGTDNRRIEFQELMIVFFFFFQRLLGSDWIEVKILRISETTDVRLR